MKALMSCEGTIATRRDATRDAISTNAMHAFWDEV